MIAMPVAKPRRPGCMHDPPGRRDERDQLGALRQAQFQFRPPPRSLRRTNYSAGNTTSTPFFFRRITMNLAGSVVLALRPTVCTSLGPS
jgi:hypothetical protein